MRRFFSSELAFYVTEAVIVLGIIATGLIGAI